MSDVEFEIVHQVWLGHVLCGSREGRTTTDVSLVTCKKCDETRERISADGP